MLSNKLCTFSQKELFWTLHEKLVQHEIRVVYGPSTLALVEYMVYSCFAWGTTRKLYFFLLKPWKTIRSKGERVSLWESICKGAFRSSNPHSWGLFNHLTPLLMSKCQPALMSSYIKVKRLIFTPKPWTSGCQIIWTFSLSRLQPSKWPSLLVSNYVHTQLYCKLGFWQQLLQVNHPANGGFEGIIVAMVTANHIHCRYNSGVRARGDIFVVEIDSIFATQETTSTWTEAMACSRKPSGSHWIALQVPAKAGN